MRKTNKLFLYRMGTIVLALCTLLVVEALFTGALSLLGAMALLPAAGLATVEAFRRGLIGGKSPRRAPVPPHGQRGTAPSNAPVLPLSLTPI